MEGVVRKMTKLTDDDKEELLKMRFKDGWSVRRISQFFDIAPSTVRYYIDPSYREKSKKASAECTRRRRRNAK